MTEAWSMDLPSSITKRAVTIKTLTSASTRLKVLTGWHSSPEKYVWLSHFPDEETKAIEVKVTLLVSGRAGTLSRLPDSKGHLLNLRAETSPEGALNSYEERAILSQDGPRGQTSAFKEGFYALCIYVGAFMSTSPTKKKKHKLTLDFISESFQISAKYSWSG